MRAWLFLGLVACGKPAPIAPQQQPLPPQAQDGLYLVWPDNDINPRRQDHKLALFEDDEWNRALACPNARSSETANAHTCHYARTAKLGLLRAGLVRQAHEHDGMYGLDDDVVLVDERKRVIATLTAASLSVVDCGTTLSLRRVASIDGALCVESVVEEGLGLFFVMDLEKDHKPWLPIRRTRTIAAFTFDGVRLRERSDLRSACPTSGYKPIFDVALDAPFVGRDALQGDAPTTQCPDESALANACGLTTTLCGPATAVD